MTNSKKPKVIREYGITYNTCPTCSAIVSYHYDPEIHETIYQNECSECGQRLIWDEEEESYYMSKMIKETVRKLKNMTLEELKECH